MLNQNQAAKINSSSASQVSSAISTAEEIKPAIESIVESKKTTSLPFQQSLPQWLTSQPPIILPSPAQKAEHLITEGRQLLANNVLDQAEAKYGEALKEIYHQEDFEGYKCHLESILGLAKVYEKRADGYIKSTALYNYALNICTKKEILEKLTEQEKSYFAEKIPEVKIALSNLENNFIAQLMRRMGKQFFNPYPCELHNKPHKDQLEAIRAYVDGELKRIDELYNIVELFNRKVRAFKAEEKWAKEIRDLYHNIAEKVKKLIRDLWRECIDTLGEPPCKYAVIGLGSLAREEMTPYSDLEFAILIEEGKDTEANKQYFRNLTNLLHLKVINLGETILPAITIFSLNNYYSDDPLYNWFYDNITPRGFTFDGAMPKACKTPLGRRDKDGNIIYELIQTPAQMASFVSEAAFKEEKTRTLSIILPTFTFICGNLILVNIYRKNITQILDKSVNLSEEKAAKMEDTNFPIYKVRERRAIKLLKKDLEDFNPELKLYADEGKLCSVKYEIYRLPEVVLDNLALFYGLTKNSSWAKIDALQNHKNFPLRSKSALHLKRICSIATALRLSTYQHYHAQRETLSALFKLKVTPTIPETDSQAARHEHYTLEQEQVTIFTEIYKTLLPLCQTVQLFMSTHGQIPISSIPALYDENPKTLGSIAVRLCDYQTAADYFEQAIKLGPTDAGLWNNRGAVLSHLDKPRETIKSFERALAIYEKRYGSDHYEVAITLVNLGAAYMLLGDVHQSKELLERALAIQEKHYGIDHYKVARTLGSLGVAYGGLGDVHREKALLECALAIEENHYGKDHYEVARTLGNLGTAYGNLGDLQREKELLERALTIEKKHYGKDHYKVAGTLANLGTVYGDLGDVHRKKALLERALTILEKQYGLDHYEVAGTLVNLGPANKELGDVHRAKVLLERALEFQEKYFGRDHYKVAITLVNLGVICMDLGDVYRSKKLLERALAIKETHYGRDHYEVAITLGSLGSVYLVLGDAHRSKELLERALAICEKHYGRDHYNIVKPLINLSIACGDLGEVYCKKALLERALAIAEKHYGRENYEVATPLINLGAACGELNDVQRAKELLERALAILEKHFGPEHYEVARTLGNLGHVYALLGDVPRAKELSARALMIQEKHYGRDHYEVAKLLINVGGVYLTLGDVQQATIFLERALTLQEKHYGRNHYEVARTLVCLGSAYGDLGDIYRKQALLEHALTILEKHYGPEHYVVTTTLVHLGAVYLTLGDAQQARVLLERALAIQENHYGPDHYEVAITRNNLGCAYLTLKDYDQARKHFEFSHQVFLKNFGPNHEYTQNTSRVLVISLNSEAMAHMAAGNLGSAIISFENALGWVNNNSELDSQPDEIVSILRNLACLYHVCSYQQEEEQKQLRDLQQAESYFQQAIRLDPNTGLYVEYAHFLYCRRQFEEAIINLKKVLPIGDDSKFNYGSLGKPILDKYLQQEIDQYGKLTIQTNLLVCYLLIKCYYILKQTVEMQYYLFEFTSKVKSAQDPLFYRLLSYVHRFIGNDDQAELYFAKGLSFETHKAEEKSEKNVVINPITVPKPK